MTICDFCKCKLTYDDDHKVNVSVGYAKGAPNYFFASRHMCRECLATIGDNVRKAFYDLLEDKRDSDG